MHVIRLSPLDNIVVLARSVQAGDVVEIDGRAVAMTQALGLGHKLCNPPGEGLVQPCGHLGLCVPPLHPADYFR